jgi:hypothetical protein
VVLLTVAVDIGQWTKITTDAYQIWFDKMLVAVLFHSKNI